MAAFHSLVGMAALSTAVGDFVAHDPAHTTSAFHDISLYLGAWMGSITATGSVIAWGKLSENMDSGAMALDQRDNINMGLAGVSAAGLLGFVGSSDPALCAIAPPMCGEEQTRGVDLYVSQHHPELKGCK